MLKLPIEQQKALLKQAMRLRPTHFHVAELRGPEVLEFFKQQTRVPEKKR